MKFGESALMQTLLLLASYMNKKILKKIGVIVLEVFVVLALISPVYHLICGIGLKKIYTKENISIYAGNTQSQEEAINLVDTLLMNLKSFDASYTPDCSIYFCNSDAEFRIKSIVISDATPEARTRPNLRSILIRPCNWESGIHLPSKPEIDTCSISSLVMHEILHCYEYDKLGIVRYSIKRIYENWKLEGFCDFIAAKSAFHVEKGLRIFTGLDDYNYVTKNKMRHAYSYFIYRLRTDYLLRYKQITQEEYWSTSYNEEQLDNEIRKALSDSSYTFF